MPERPFAAQARQLCPESADHHARVWFCETCLRLERRLTPLHDTPGMKELLEDANLTITYRREPL